MQVQCPNCGGFKVSGETRYVSAKTGRESKSLPKIGYGFMVVVVSFVVGLALLVNGVVWGFIPLVFGGIYLWGIIYTIRHPEKMNNKYYYNCLLCGYKGSRLESDPLPPVNLRPDLIAKGAKNLEEQQAAAAKAQRDAAAAQFLQQQRRGK